MRSAATNAAARREKDKGTDVLIEALGWRQQAPTSGASYANGNGGPQLGGGME